VTKALGRIYILVPNAEYIAGKLGYETDNQPIVNRHSLAGYKDLLTKSGLAIDRVLCDNSHLANLAESSSWGKLVLKLMVNPFIRFIPMRYSYNFIFICRPNA